jgi:putative ATP-dependent endonuclease of OLD family
MKITRLRIQNFRSIHSLELDLGETTVFVGPNNAGKSAILDAVRIALTRRWGQRGTGFTEHDVHRVAEGVDPKTLPPVTIEIVLEEPAPKAWDADMVAALEDILGIFPDGRNVLSLRVSCPWNVEKEAFDPVWEFLDESGAPMTGKAQRATNLTGFFAYLPLFWLGALRDADDEFASRSGHWGRLLKGVRIPDDLEADALRILSELDAKIIAADPRLSRIADVIGQSTHVAVGETPGAARLNMLPVGIEDMLQRAGVILRNEDTRPWFPLGHHGQGLQSLAVIFLFQAAVLQQLSESDRPGLEAVFAIEEPEVHLHPQAARTLWERVSALTGQKMMTTHSPYFVQHVPLRDLRLVRLRGGCTEVSSIPRVRVSDIPWNESVTGFVAGPGGKIFEKDLSTNCVAARSWFDKEIADKLAHCFRTDADVAVTREKIVRLRHDCRSLPSAEDEEELRFHGRRVRGEIFFARRWILVEGVSEYLLIHALGQAFGWPLDAHGIAVIDFQQSGNAGIYPALAEAFGLPWNMIVDGDGASEQFQKQIISRGFNDADLVGRFSTLPKPNDLEDQLIADGHEKLLRDILATTGGKAVLTCPLDEFRSRLKNRKTTYMGILAPRVAGDPALAAKMPKAFIDLVKKLQEGVA